MNNSAKSPRPFLKWAGGKGQLLAALEKYYPFGTLITKYAEPFVGGGAVLFDILGRFDLEAVYISDTNAELINAYRAVRDETAALTGLLYAFQEEFLPLDKNERKVYYLNKRERFNELKLGGAANRGVNPELAALLIFLNRTCFNGLYRVNRKGLFNVPVGDYKTPLICDAGNLRAAAERLRDVTVVCGDYRQSAGFIDRHTFAYFDPPYRPLSQTASFTAYTQAPFDDAAQLELAEFVRLIDRRGAKFAVSNSDPHNAGCGDDFFEKAYASFKIRRVEAARMINCNSRARGKISELIISNF